MYRVGLDLGSSYTKGVLVDSNNKIVDFLAVKTGFDFHKASHKIIDYFTTENKKITYPVYSCGYGREQLDVAFKPHSEITSLARAVFAEYRRNAVVIDIGGQDTKYVKINDAGMVEKFRLNRKCAAGTGAFLEEIAFRLDISPEDFNEAALDATNKDTQLNSFCTVFAVSEIIGMIKQGISLPNIAIGVYNSILSRCMELAAFDDFLILTGGIPSKHPVMLELFRDKFSDVTSPKLAQYMAAYGSVLLNS